MSALWWSKEVSVSKNLRDLAIGMMLVTVPIMMTGGAIIGPVLVALVIRATAERRARERAAREFAEARAFVDRLPWSELADLPDEERSRIIGRVLAEQFDEQVH
jgi:hypothetical protein